jgi:hypothetical protein
MIKKIYWMEFKMSDLEKMEQNIQIPSSKLDDWSKMKFLMEGF